MNTNKRMQAVALSWLLGTVAFTGLSLSPFSVLAEEPALPQVAQQAQGAEAPLPAEDYVARLEYHKANKADLRLAPIQANDRRKAVPNDPRPPAVLEPSVMLPALPVAMEGTVRRVELANGEKVCALTFDLCELATVTTGFDADIVTWLQDKDIPATLFMGGKWMRTHAKRVRAIMRDPLFEIANHAWAHGNFGIMTPERMREEILYAQAQYELLRKEAIEEAGRIGVYDAGIPPVPRFFRFPYGRCCDASLKMVNDLGLRAIQWDVVAENGGRGNASLAQGREVADRVKPGSILLFHANLVPNGTFQLLRYVVRELEQRGYRFVYVGELLQMGRPVVSRDGYFLRPGDNKALDAKYGIDGTGRK